MTTLTDIAPDARLIQPRDRAVTFEQYLNSTDEDSDLELVKGVLVNRMSAQYDHELLFAWLFTILNGYVGKTNLGRVLGSRMAVEIDQFGGRLPDLLFVARERLDIIRQRAVFGAPDLVVEIRSPHDRPAGLSELEVDYRGLGVREIVFIDPRKEEVLVLRKTQDGYAEETVRTGTLTLMSVPGFSLDVAWLFASERPNEVDILLDLLAR